MTTWKELTYPDSTIDDWDQATIAEADAYHSARGNTDWASATDPNKTIALQRSWDYLRGLSWLPNVFDTELPDDVKNAQILGALYELASAGSLLPTITSGDYLTKKNIANVIIKEYSSAAPSSPVYTELNALLQLYITNTVNSIPLVRG